MARHPGYAWLSAYLPIRVLNKVWVYSDGVTPQYGSGVVLSAGWHAAIGFWGAYTNPSTVWKPVFDMRPMAYNVNLLGFSASSHSDLDPGPFTATATFGSGSTSGSEEFIQVNFYRLVPGGSWYVVDQKQAPLGGGSATSDFVYYPGDQAYAACFYGNQDNTYGPSTNTATISF